MKAYLKLWILTYGKDDDKASLKRWICTYGEEEDDDVTAEISLLDWYHIKLVFMHELWERMIFMFLISFIDCYN